MNESQRLAQHDVERKPKLPALRHAAKQGFDEIDQGKGIILKGKKRLDRYFKDIEFEVLTKPARHGE